MDLDHFARKRENGVGAVYMGGEKGSHGGEAMGVWGLVGVDIGGGFGGGGGW